MSDLEYIFTETNRLQYESGVLLEGVLELQRRIKAALDIGETSDCTIGSICEEWEHHGHR
jgi:hypothetical protein